MAKPFKVLRHKMSVEAQQRAKEKAAKLLAEMALLESNQQTSVKEQEVTSVFPSSPSVTPACIKQKI